MALDFSQLAANRVKGIEASGIRRIFDLAATIKDAINLSIGQPDFDAPEPVTELQQQLAFEDDGTVGRVHLSRILFKI